MNRSEETFDVPDQLNILNKALVKEIHDRYIHSGADMILTNTFSSTPSKLLLSGIIEHEQIVRQGVKIAREAAGDKTLVVGNIGPTGILPYPVGEGRFDDYYQEYRNTASIMIEEGVDAIMLETFSDMLELKSAYLAVRELSSDIFIIAMMTFDIHGRNLTGTDPRNFAVTFNDLDVDAIGINCSLGPEEMVSVFSEISRFSNKLLVIEPNAGMPIIDEGEVTYPVGHEEFSDHVETFLDLGANIIGGCCGTDERYIEGIRTAVGDRKPAERDHEEFPTVTSPLRMTLFDDFVVIGERINPAGRKKLRTAMEKGDMGPIMEEARAQVRNGAKILDMNFGHESSIPIEYMEEALLKIIYNIGVPISLDVQTIGVLERLMRIYPGRPLINSSSLTDEDLDIKIDLISRYGGMLIVLAMGKKVPRTADDRILNIRKGMDSLLEKNIKKERILFDPIILSMGTGKDPFDTLKAIEYISSKGFLSVCGLSNLSFGLPDRTYYNASFLALAVERNISSAIMNPLDATLMGLLRASLVISGKMDIPRAEIEEEDKLIKAFLEGDQAKAVELTQALSREKDPLKILQEDLKNGMERIGLLYSKGKIFLPQLIQAAQTSKPCFDMIERSLPVGKGKDIFLIATVKGDIHDIGKNIASAVIRSSGFEVIDLGKDVDSKIIVSQIKEKKPLAIGLSAMMTTTAGRIKEIVDMIRNEDIDVKVIAGGASLNDKIVKEYGADLYAESPIDAIDFLKTL